MNDQQRAAMQMALEAFDSPVLKDPFEQSMKLRRACDALRSALQEHALQTLSDIHQEMEKPQCNQHPDAPHGFDRNASHSADRYVCECESWEQPQDNLNCKSVQARLATSWGYVKAQPQGEWVDLTVDEIAKALNTADSHNTIDSYRAVIAKFKQKNAPPSTETDRENVMKMVVVSGDVTLKIEVDICYKYHTLEQIDEQLEEIAKNMGCRYLYVEGRDD